MESSSVVNFSSALAKEKEEEVDVSVPTGYKFLPTDLELLRNYLCKKITNQKLPSDLPVVEFDIYATEPWNLPENNKIDKINSKRSYYFVRLSDGIGRKRIVNPSSAADDNGGRRRKGGYWEKIAESRRCIRDEKNKSIGVKKSFVFHAYLNPSSAETSSTASMRTWKTNWMLDEYSLNSQRNHPWVLCIVRNKGGDEDELELLASIEQLPEKIEERPSHDDVHIELEIMEQIKEIQEGIKCNQIQIWNDQYQLFMLNESRVRFRIMKQRNICARKLKEDKWNEVEEGKITLDDYIASGDHLDEVDKKELAALDAEIGVIRAGSYYQVEKKLNRFKTKSKRKNKNKKMGNHLCTLF